MADLRLVANAMFNKKDEWINIPDKEKEECFFIFNRYFSKVYPEKSYFLNSKSINKPLAMDMWYNYMLKQPYPRWFWSKGGAKEKSKVSNPDFKLLLKNLKIKEFDLKYLIDNYYSFIKEELTYLKKLQKQ